MCYIQHLCTISSLFVGIGPVNAMKLLRQHGNIEKILKGLSGKVCLDYSSHAIIIVLFTQKYQIPENWPFEVSK